MAQAKEDKRKMREQGMKLTPLIWDDTEGFPEEQFNSVLGQFGLKAMDISSKVGLTRGETAVVIGPEAMTQDEALEAMETDVFFEEDIETSIKRNRQEPLTEEGWEKSSYPMGKSRRNSFLDDFGK